MIGYVIIKGRTVRFYKKIVKERQSYWRTLSFQDNTTQIIVVQKKQTEVDS